MFYTAEIIDKRAVFLPEESAHIAKVLRKKEGDEIQFTDGAGSLYNGRITVVDAHQVEAQIMSVKKTDCALPPIHIVVAPTKNMDRMEWFVEKAVEVGVAEISFIITKNSERKTLKTDRLEKIAISAMKQSNQLWLPKINELTTLKEILKRAETFDGDRFFGYCGKTDFYTQTTINIETLQIETEELNEPFFYSEAINENVPVIVLIGPEGDFTESEAKQCVDCGFLPVVLTKTRLRTETAALLACWNYAVRFSLLQAAIQNDNCF
jgi:16S rRNA (uracil1498-N3)-methyltransferase